MAECIEGFANLAEEWNHITPQSPPLDRTICKQL